MSLEDVTLTVGSIGDGIIDRLQRIPPSVTLPVISVAVVGMFGYLYLLTRMFQRGFQAEKSSYMFHSNIGINQRRYREDIIAGELPGGSPEQSQECIAMAFFNYHFGLPCHNDYGLLSVTPLEQTIIDYDMTNLSGFDERLVDISIRDCSLAFLMSQGFLEDKGDRVYTLTKKGKQLQQQQMKAVDYYSRDDMTPALDDVRKKIVAGYVIIEEQNMNATIQRMSEREAVRARAMEIGSLIPHSS